MVGKSKYRCQAGQDIFPFIVFKRNDGSYVHTKKEDTFTLPDGTLSGSLLTLLQAVKNCVDLPCTIDSGK